MYTFGRFSTVLRMLLAIYFALYLQSCETTRTPPSSSYATASIGGRVVNDRGEPVNDAKIYFVHESKSHADSLHTVVESDHTGRWMHIPNRPTPLKRAIVVEHSEYAPTIFDASPQLLTELSNHSAELKIDKGLEFSGTTVDQLGHPVHGATLRVLLPISTARQVQYWPNIVLSRIDGTFDLRIPSKTSCSAFLFARGYREQSFELTAKTPPLTLTLTPYEKLRGRIVDESGLPVKKAEITLHPSDDEFWNGVEMSVSPDGWCAQTAGGETWVRKSNSDGIFEWIELENNRYDLSVRCDGFRDLALTLPTSEDILTITLHRALRE